MAIRIVQLGTARSQDEGLRIGTVRLPPRGVRKGAHSKLDYYDVWMPELAPGPKLVCWLFQSHSRRSGGLSSSAATGRRCASR